MHLYDTVHAQNSDSDSNSKVDDVDNSTGLNENVRPVGIQSNDLPVTEHELERERMPMDKTCRNVLARIDNVQATFRLKPNEQSVRSYVLWLPQSAKYKVNGNRSVGAAVEGSSTAQSEQRSNENNSGIDGQPTDDSVAIDLGEKSGIARPMLNELSKT